MPENIYTYDAHCLLLVIIYVQSNLHVADSLCGIEQGMNILEYNEQRACHQSYQMEDEKSARAIPCVHIRQFNWDMMEPWMCLPT
jgi:hypothetical protein